MFYLIKIHILKIYSMPLFSCIQKKGTKSTDIELTFEFRVSMLTVQRYFNQGLELLTLHSWKHETIVYNPKRKLSENISITISTANCLKSTDPLQRMTMYYLIRVVYMTLKEAATFDSLRQRNINL